MNYSAVPFLDMIKNKLMENEETKTKGAKIHLRRSEHSLDSVLNMNSDHYISFRFNEKSVSASNIILNSGERHNETLEDFSHDNLVSDYTGTNLGSVYYKSTKNFLLVVTILMIIVVYYSYTQLTVVTVLASSKQGLDYRFWDHRNLSDKVYLRGSIYFVVFHVFFLLLMFLFYKVLFTQPGYFTEDYIKIFSLKAKLQGESRAGSRLESDSDNSPTGQVNLNYSDLEQVFDEDSLKEAEESKICLKLERKKRIKLFRTMYNLIDSQSYLKKKICRFCLIVKPEKAHHCRVCRRCVLMYDHHCKFLANCVGFLNFKYFMLFLFYSIVILLFVLGTSVEPLVISVNHLGWESAKAKMFVVFYLFILILFCSVLDLFLYQVNILTRGVSRVEEKLKSAKKKNNDICHNISRHMGEGTFSWFLPTSNHNLMQNLN